MYYLKEIEKEDLVIINEWRANSELIKHLGSSYRYINKDVDQQWYEHYINNRDTNIRCSIFDDDKLLGLISLTNIDWINRSANLHIMIGDDEDRTKGSVALLYNKY